MASHPQSRGRGRGPSRGSRPLIVWAFSLLVSLTMTMASGFAVEARAGTKLLRFPDLHGDQIVFVYAGDLWACSTDGGSARRLTAHPGLELFPKFSPDGRWIAFTGQYDGDEQVYVIPSGGGEPRQLTYYPARGPLPARWGYDNQVTGWTPDGKGIVFRSYRDSWATPLTRLYVAPVVGGLAKALPMPTSGVGDLSPDGGKIVYSPLARDFRTWKRYQGGWAQDLYIFDLKTQELEPVAHSPRTERDPMWIKDAVVFASDRDDTLNLYRFDIAAKTVKPLTQEMTWDVRWPSKAEDDRIVFELAGELRIIDAQTGAVKPIEINVPDDGLAKRPSRVSAAKAIEQFGLSPKGERAVVSARGDVFTVPAEKGDTRNLTRSSNAHDKLARWSPDGKTIAFVSDRSGEEEIYVIAQDGRSEPSPLTRDSKAMIFTLDWAPDGKRLSYSDKNGKLRVVEVADKSAVEVADDRTGSIGDAVWSPDSRFLAFSLSHENGNSVLAIWGRDDKQLREITNDFFNATEPAWDPDGKYLYYLSDREFAPQLSAIEWNYAGNRNVGIFALALRKDAPHPFPPQSDEATTSEEVKTDPAKSDKDKDKADKEKAKGEKAAPIAIDFEGLGDRSARVPVASDNYRALSAIKGHLVYVRTSAPYYGRESESKPVLRIFAVKEREEATLADGVGGYSISEDGKKILVRQGPGLVMMDANPKGAAGKKPISTEGLQVDRVPSQEWEQIFHEVWRRYRDFFYVENMHGYDWDALRRQYQPLLAHVSHRSDLNYVIGEMIAELNVGHAYITGGDFEVPDRPKVALFGGRLEWDADANRYKIVKIFKGQNEEPLYRSPLTEIGVHVSVGDYLLAIDGEELKPDEDPYRLLRDKADRVVRLTVGKEPKLDGARDVSIRPIADESKLIYLEMVETNRAKVAKMSDGRFGYIHIPDMGEDGIREFIKTYYPQIRKQGLVVDVRYNGGGNVSQMLIERLSRELLGTRFARNNDFAGTYPSQVFYGHMVCLINENSASDGDIFPARFKKAGLGPLIGKRTWGGVIGITNHGDLIDGGTVNVPEFGTNDADGSWIIEGVGVPPDIETANTPKAVIGGGDPQLERGVQELRAMVEKSPRRLPDRPEPPVKTKGKK